MIEYVVNPSNSTKHTIKSVIGNGWSEQSKESATSESLEVCYDKGMVSFSTWRTDFMIGDTISVSGINVKVLSIAYKQYDYGSLQEVTGVYYE